MRAVRCHTLTGPTGLRVDVVADPEPGPGEVVIDVRAAGVNFPDVLLTEGKYQLAPPLPFIPGGEAAGIVLAVGPGVTTVRVGQRVAATALHGAFAERFVAPAEQVVELPEDVGFETGAATLLTYLTTMHALVDRAHLQPKETLLVLGAAGGVGTAAVELGKRLGARVIAVASSPEKLEHCRRHGADEVIDSSREDVKARAKTLTHGDGVDVVYDPVGGPATEAAVRSLAWGGRHLVVGFASGEIPKVPANLLLLKGAALVGVFWGAFSRRDPVANRAHANRLFQWISAGEVHPHVDGVYPFTDAEGALQRLAKREVRGKVLLVP